MNKPIRPRAKPLPAPEREAVRFACRRYLRVLRDL